MMTIALGTMAIIAIEIAEAINVSKKL